MDACPKVKVKIFIHLPIHLFVSDSLVHINTTTVKKKAHKHRQTHSHTLKRANKTRSSVVADRPRDASCLSVVSFNIPTSQFFITSYCGFRFTSA